MGHLTSVPSSRAGKLMLWCPFLPSTCWTYTTCSLSPNCDQSPSESTHIWYINTISMLNLMEQSWIKYSAYQVVRHKKPNIQPTNPSTAVVSGLRVPIKTDIYGTVHLKICRAVCKTIVKTKDVQTYHLFTKIIFTAIWKAVITHCWKTWEIQ